MRIKLLEICNNASYEKDKRTYEIYIETDTIKKLLKTITESQFDTFFGEDEEEYEPEKNAERRIIEKEGVSK